MDFFTNQAEARKRTGRLIFLFVLGLIGIIGVTYFLIAWVNAFAVYGNQFELQDLLDYTLFIWVSFFTTLIVGLASLWKISQLKSGGGAYVAESMGGRLLDPNKADSQEKILLNVVEEMAIASGVPTPPVYIMNKEVGINAFAAGGRPDTAIICVTRGTLEKLDRDELQGVIGHEFSHILNGDMKINIRLMGLLFGILVLWLIGNYAIRSSMYARYSNESRGSTFIFFALGIGLMAIGGIGCFFGRLIQAAVSRQREYLADASAVQFTRNPEGIGSALKKIRDDQYQSIVFNPGSAAISHMFFAQSFLSGPHSWFATHPPIERRIARIFSVDEESIAELPPPPSLESMSSQASPVSFLNSVGTPDIEQIRYAKSLLEALPRTIKIASKDPFGARAVIYGLLLSRDPSLRSQQIDMLATHSYVGVWNELQRLLPDIDRIPDSTRVPLIDLMIPTFYVISKRQYEVFRDNVWDLIYFDNQVDIFEWTLQKILIKHLDRHFRFPEDKKPLTTLEHCRREAEVLFEVLSHLNAPNDRVWLDSLNEARLHLDFEPLQTLPPEKKGFEAIDQALSELRFLRPRDKKRLLEGALLCIRFDHQVTVFEAELFRAIGDALDVPVPLVLPSEIRV